MPPSKKPSSLSRKKRKARKADKRKQRGFFQRFALGLRGYFLTGLVIAAPISITIYLMIWFVDLVDGQVRVLFPEQYHPDNFIPFTIPGLGLIIIVFSLTLLGALAANFFGRTLVSMGEKILERMPVVRTLYTTLKQIFEMVFTKDDMPFRKAGLIEYPRKGLYALVFLTVENKSRLFREINSEEPLIGVFLPTTPNPTSGFFLMVPKSEVILLDMKVEDVAKMVVSAGLVEPGEGGALQITGQNAQKLAGS